jgi:hypothetical protein
MKMLVLNYDYLYNVGLVRNIKIYISRLLFKLELKEFICQIKNFGVEQLSVS